MDKLVIQELTEDAEFLNQELIECVDRSSKNTYTMGFDRVQHLVN